jgi:DNA-binding NtrC family response regulator
MPVPVLVVHDEIDTLALAVGALRAAGLEALGFGDPMDGLKAIEADSQVRVLVTRMNFGRGKLNGLALARMLLVKRRGLKTVFVARAEYEHFAEDVGEFVPMPLNTYHLVDVVARLLGDRNARVEGFWSIALGPEKSTRPG